jgi:2-polyprenyl-6-methoxyphenol hydroxylase-like FAD-dependent oxidoreductase
MKVTIIGAGIGGLTLALALEQQGIEAEIFEATPVFKPVGAGIVLAINAMQIYKRLGLVEALKLQGRSVEAMHITSPQLKPYSSSTLLPSEKKFGVGALTIHRAALHEVLRAGLQKTTIHLGKRLLQCQKQGNSYQLEWTDGTHTTANILVGADGIHSQVRAALFPYTKERFAKEWCWRGVCEYDIQRMNTNAVYEAWGKGCRFGIVPLSDNQVYWFACANVTEQKAKAIDQQGLQVVFESFHPVIGQLIAHTPNHCFLLNQLSDLPNNQQWHQGNCCLIGDAAHATTPNMGQGANQAIESAWVLAEQLAKHQDVPTAFDAYQTMRQAKAQKIIQTSWQIGQLAQVQNPILMGIRRAILALTPASVTQQQMEQIYKLGY